VAPSRRPYDAQAELATALSLATNRLIERGVAESARMGAQGIDDDSLRRKPARDTTSPRVL